jgi:hypothetical protein
LCDEKEREVMRKRDGNGRGNKIDRKKERIKKERIKKE